MLNIIGSYLDIKRSQRRQHEIELAYLDTDLRLAKVENELIKLEEPKVRPYLAREFAMQRAFSHLGFKTKSTEECITMARLWARKP